MPPIGEKISSDEEIEQLEIEIKLSSDNTSNIRYSPEGIEIVSKVSLKQLKEDLAQSKNEYRLSEERRNELIQNALHDVLIFCCENRADQNILENLFPGMDMLHPENYDHKQAAIKIFILDHDNYQSFEDATDLFRNERTKQISSLGSRISKTGMISRSIRMFGLTVPGVYKVIEVESNNVLLVLDEQAGFRDFSDDQLYKLEGTLSKVIKHELFHSIETGDQFAKVVQEGIVNMYTLLATKRPEYTPKYSKMTGCGLVFGTTTLLYESGVSADLIRKVFFGPYDAEARHELHSKMTKILGKDFTDDFFYRDIPLEEEQKYEDYVFSKLYH